MLFRLLFCFSVFATLLRAVERPHVLWITSEDNGPQMGCYGDSFATTPNLDRLAAAGMRYNNVWSVAPVCAPARTALITGVYPSSSGSLHMRSDVKLPAAMQLFPQLLRETGYYCTNCEKEDYNVAKPGKVWDESSRKAHWRNRAPDQPFFAVFNFTDTHESQIRARPHQAVHNPSKVPLPPYWPDTPEVRRDWAQYYDQMTVMDAKAGRLLDDLKKDGLAADTIVFYFGDHGPGMPRCKRSACNSGLRVPLIVYFPEKWKHLAPAGYAAGAANDRLVSFVDFAPTMLSLAGLPVPAWMQGRAFAGPSAGPNPDFLYGMRDRMDERYDPVRSVRDQRFVYVRNYFPHRPGGQHNAYMFETPATQVWHRLFCEGKLNEAQSAFWKPHPPEELYDLSSDPFEIRNLANDPAHRGILERLQAAHVAHERAVRDVCLLPEAEMLRRAGGGAPYTVGHDDSRFPLEAILRTAQRASSQKQGDLRELRDALKASDSAIRWWAVMGHLMHGKDAVTAAADRLNARLKDENVSVRIAAAETLAKCGRESDQPAALDLLLSAADLRETGYFDAVRALNALDDLREQLSPAQKDRLAALPRTCPAQNQRTSDYAQRLLEHIAGK
ncbi:MAG TPA: sulfatase-like hydrolase/transferase [Verrucomicrobiales bacterium]|nr:sulfatase-like hydrolase/transferase [Verrucomicrobiales bacterium]